MIKYKQHIKEKDDRAIRICHRCNYTWFTKSLEKFVKCPNCRTSVKNLE